MSEWQPIETAPKDGSYILISAGHDRFGIKYRVTYMAYWAEQMYPHKPKEWHYVDTHQPLPYEAHKWMPVPREIPGEADNGEASL